MTSPDSPSPSEKAPTEPAPAPAQSPSSSSSAPLSTQRLVMAGAGAALVLTVVTVALLRPPPPPDEALASSSSAASLSERSWKEKQPFVPGPLAPVGMFVDVVRPTALRLVLTENAWLKATAAEPLGRGFLGGWAGFLGSPGEELGLQKLTQGVIGELIVDAILVQPVRVAFFAGGGGAAPALVIPAPSEALSTTYAAVVAAVERGGFTLEGCPGDPTPPPVMVAVDGAVDGGVDGGTPASAAKKNQLALSRLVIADQPVFATLARGRLVLSREPQSVVNALCGELPTIAAVPGADVVFGVAPAQLGRDAQAFAGVLGLAGSPLLAFKVEGTSLRPVGLSAAVNKPDRLASEPVADALWGFVPEDLPVAAAVNLRLPQTLSAKSLQSMYAGERPTLSTRQVLVLWQPHGESGHDTEVAVVWSDPADREGVQQLFSGPNALTVRVVCERVVASSSAALLSRIEAACTKRSPSLSFAAPAVVQGLQTKTSVGLVVDLGRLLSTLLHEGFMSDPAVTQKKGELPVEIEAAKKRLLELPRFGFFGDVQGDTLVPRGFSS